MIAPTHSGGRGRRAAPVRSLRAALRPLAAIHLVWLALLSACAAPLVAPEQSGAPDREFSGRISVQYRDPGADHDQGLHGNFDWVEHGDVIDLSLLDPLGQTVALVHQGLSESTLTLRDGHVLRGPDAQSLTTQALGFVLPVAGLRWWLNGQAAPPVASAHDATNADGLRILEQDGWRISYPVTEPGSSKRLDLHYPGPGVAVDLRILIDSKTPA